MKGEPDMTFESAQAGMSQSRTTAAGLDAWLIGMRADASDLGASPAGDADPMAPVAEVIGPVNAAEALALALSQGTFSSARKLTGPDGAELIVDPEQNGYYFESTSLKPLAALLGQPASAWTPVYSVAIKATREANTAQPLERLRWFAGLIATPGILGRSLNRSERYKLSRWPETEREYPKHFRIAKEMLKSPATADEIAAASGMPFEDVADYMNASFAAGRLESNTPAPAEEGNAPATTRRERLMARLNKPLFVR